MRRRVKTPCVSSDHSASRSRRCGFTFIEVLVAFALLMVGFITGAVAFGRHLGVTRLLQNSLTARALADRVMVEAKERDAAGLEIALKGTQEHFSWEVLEPQPIEEVEEIEQVLVEVSWQDRERLRTVRLEAGFPSQAGGGESP